MKKPPPDKTTWIIIGVCVLVAGAVIAYILLKPKDTEILAPSVLTKTTPPPPQAPALPPVAPVAPVSPPSFPPLAPVSPPGLGLTESPAPAPLGLPPVFGPPAPAPSPVFSAPAPASFDSPAPAPSPVFGSPAPSPVFGSPEPASFDSPAPVSCNFTLRPDVTGVTWYVDGNVSQSFRINQPDGCTVTVVFGDNTTAEYTIEQNDVISILVSPQERYYFDFRPGTVPSVYDNSSLTGSALFSLTNTPSPISGSPEPGIEPSPVFDTPAPAFDSPAPAPVFDAPAPAPVPPPGACSAECETVISAVSQSQYGWIHDFSECQTCRNRKYGNWPVFFNGQFNTIAEINPIFDDLIVDVLLDTDTVIRMRVHVTNGDPQRILSGNTGIFNIDANGVSSLKPSITHILLNDDTCGRIIQHNDSSGNITADVIDSNGAVLIGLQGVTGSNNPPNLRMNSGNQMLQSLKFGNLNSPSPIFGSPTPVIAPGIEPSGFAPSPIFGSPSPSPPLGVCPGDVLFRLQNKFRVRVNPDGLTGHYMEATDTDSWTIWNNWAACGADMKIQLEIDDDEFRLNQFTDVVRAGRIYKRFPSQPQTGEDDVTVNFGRSF